MADPFSGGNVSFLPPTQTTGSGSGTVTSVTAGDTTITVAGTATDPTVKVGTLVPGSNGVPTLAAADASVTVGGTATARTVGLPLSAATPLAPGTAAAGTSTTKSNDDHRHAPLIRKVLGTWLLSNIPANASTSLNLKDADTNFPRMTIMRTCTLTGISCYLSGNPAGSNPVVNILKNGSADTTLQLTITAGSTRAFSTTGTGVALAAADSIQFQIVTDASWTSTTVDISVVCEVTETA